ncbi:hypothetical protein Tco_0769729 [Tanacetum coccineum]|uniref:Uncharacterized protein n=1 Tax=Tanacetum coccineum TaxID=301880 RepID=A0ABQ4ZDU4_9ASTR
MVLDNSKGDQSRERESTSFSSFHLTGSHKFVNHVGESGDLVTETVSKGDTSVVLTTKFEKTKASIQVTHEDKEDDVVMEDEKVMCLGTLDYGVYGMKNNASTIGVSKIRVVDVYDGMFNFSERDGSTNFNKLVEMYNGKYDDNKEKDDDFVVCDLVQPKGVDVLGKDYGTGFIKGLEDVNRTGNVSVRVSYIDNHPQIVQMCDFKLEQERVESLSPKLGLNSGTTASSFEQSLTYGMEFKIEMSNLNENFIHLEEAKKNGDCLGRLKFDIWKWPKRKKVACTKCKIRHGKWKFDIWKWPKRKRKGARCRHMESMFFSGKFETCLIEVLNGGIKDDATWEPIEDIYRRLPTFD